jgi:signal transduction histidine kinase
MGRQRILDLGIAAVLAAAMVIEMVVRDDNRTETTPLGIAICVIAVLPTFARHRYPGWSMAACMALLFGVLAIVDVHNTAPFSSMLCGYSLALVADRRRLLLAMLVLVPAVLAAILLYSDHRTLLDPEIPKNLVFVAAPLILGRAVRNQRNYLAALVDRAETAERTRDEEARRRVGEERLRIARDVHDVVAHAMVAINVQAGVGAHLLDRDPEQARRTLKDIEKVSSEALSDLRSTLGMLRADTADNHAADNHGAPVRPAQGLRELDELSESLRTAGIEVDLDVDPATATLPASVTSTGYRIVQEALTNVVRHAGGSHARVRVTRGDDALVIEVDDDGGDEVSAAPPGAGHGVRGMRERAQAAGGTLEAGPLAGGGWRVVATLPTGVPTGTP